MPISLEPTRNIQMVRDKNFYGFKPDNVAHLKTTKKHVPWVDVSDDEKPGKQSSMKRKVSAINGHSQHAQNGHKHKKYRGSNEIWNQINGDTNGADPSQTKHIHGANPNTSQHIQHTKVKAMQEQRMQLPIAKGSFILYI
jgi:hypothetical protein